MSKDPAVVKRPKLMATIGAIGSVYDVIPQSFSVGEHRNEAGENQGSLAILGFAKMQGLNEAQVLPMFGEAAREVLDNPEGTDHGNIRAFLRVGMDGVKFDKGDGIELKPSLQNIEDIWEKRTIFSPGNTSDIIMNSIEEIIDQLDAGVMRVAMKLGDDWFTNQAVKKAILLSFRTRDNYLQKSGDVNYFDKVGTKFTDWTEEDFRDAGIRIVPGSVIRKGAFMAKNVIQMPSFVNIGAYIDEGTMVDGAGTTVGSCAQIGKRVHLSMGVGIGGVLEPLQNNPVIVEDDCFLGAGANVVEGVILRRGAVLSMGVHIGKNTPIVDRTKDGNILYGEVPPYAVVMMGVHPKNGILCPQIMKYRDAKTDAATALNELLRA